MKQSDKSSSIQEHLRAIVDRMPELPGSYQFWNADGVVIYVGKAKRLKRRVSSYFRKDVDRLKTRLLVDKIADITYTVVKTEEDALLLENELIKKYQPRYNILLKDGKTYPYICVTKEAYPRVFSTRRRVKGAGDYYGPYAHAGAMHAILQLVHQLYRLRSCRTALTSEGVAEGKYRTCLDYHIRRCDAPCVGKISKEEYNMAVRQVVEILKGNTRALAKQTYAEMEACAGRMEFEKAEELKQRYLLLEGYCAKSEVVSATLTNVDVFSLTNDDDGKMSFVNYLHVVNGAVNQAFTYEYKRTLADDDADLLATAIAEIRRRHHSEAREVVVPFSTEWPVADVIFTVPQRGDKKKLLELSLMNGRQYRLDRLKQSEKLNPEQRQTRLMKQLQSLLQLPRLPMQIECFDNSNIAGSDAVAACVVYRAMKPSRKDYRKYIIREADTQDDYAQMQEVVRRRYRRMLDEGASLPDLIVTDGGAGHMSAVRQVVEGELQLSVPIAGLAKDGRHRTHELLYGTPPQVVGLSPKDELFRVLTQMQDEVHRVAISFHRDKRSKHALHSELDDVKGVGKKTQDALLKHFKSVKRVREATAEELAAVVGVAKAKLLVAHFLQAQEGR
ncbi:MAG: excinuclease ABC subunit C [Bacteroidaceae bacterium]|nr:excinuclease ABC subunit C [Bacteroidaceae bacterium]